MVANTLKGIHVVLLLCVTAVCGEYCYYYYDDSLSWNYCSRGCCGSSCCETAVGVIVGGVVGSIAFVATVVSIIVVIYYCCRKTQGRYSQVLQPVTTSTTNGFGVQTSTGYTQQDSGQPGYGQPGYTQPGYSQIGHNHGGYTNQGFSGQMPMSYMQPGADQKLEPQPQPCTPPQTASST